MEENRVNYKKIFEDILKIKYPEKKNRILPLIEVPDMSSIDIITINNMIFDVVRTEEDTAHRSYKKADIFKILEYQAKNKLTNTEVAKQYKMSRNTISKWKKKFFVK